MKITAISFDFWNTIYVDHQHTYERHSERVNFLRDALIKCGYNNEYDIEGSFKYCWDYFDKIWKNEHRTLNAAQLLQVGLEHLTPACADASAGRPSLSKGEGDGNIVLPPDEFKLVVDFFENILLKYPPGLFDDAESVIPKLAQKYKLGITSDTAYTPGRVLKQLLEKDGLLQCFSAFTFSDEAGCSKPDPQTFRNTLNQLSSKPHEAIHVGDNEYTDIEGGIEAGMKTILFTAGLKNKDVETEADYKVNSWLELIELMHFI